MALAVSAVLDMGVALAVVGDVEVMEVLEAWAELAV